MRKASRSEKKAFRRSALGTPKSNLAQRQANRGGLRR